ncbi:hypothetical protein AAHH78_32670, partial [Burkholderia pseudomallei]
AAHTNGPLTGAGDRAAVRELKDLPYHGMHAPFEPFIAPHPDARRGPLVELDLLDPIHAAHGALIESY